MLCKWGVSSNIRVDQGYRQSTHQGAIARRLSLPRLRRTAACVNPAPPVCRERRLDRRSDILRRFAPVEETLAGGIHRVRRVGQDPFGRRESHAGVIRPLSRFPHPAAHHFLEFPPARTERALRKELGGSAQRVSTGQSEESAEHAIGDVRSEFQVSSSPQNRSHRISASGNFP